MREGSSSVNFDVSFRDFEDDVKKSIKKIVSQTLGKVKLQAKQNAPVSKGEKHRSQPPSGALRRSITKKMFSNSNGVYGNVRAGSSKAADYVKYHFVVEFGAPSDRGTSERGIVNYKAQPYLLPARSAAVGFSGRIRDAINKAWD